MLKRITLSIVCLLLLCSIATAGSAVVTFYDGQNAGYSYVEVAVTGDGSETTVDFTQCVGSSTGDTFDCSGRFKGNYIYRVKTIPGTGAATPAAYTIDFDDADGDTYLPVTARSTTNAEWYKGYLTTTGQYEVIVAPITMRVSADILTDDTTFIRIVLGKWRD